MASARCRRWLRCCCRGARCRGCRRWRRLRLGSQQTWTLRRHRFTGGVEVPPYAKPAAVYKGITRGFTVSTVPVMLAALPGRLRIIAAWRLGKPHVSLPHFAASFHYGGSPALPSASPSHSLAAAAVCGCWLRRLARCGIAEPKGARIPLGPAYRRHRHRR